MNMIQILFFIFLFSCGNSLGKKDLKDNKVYSSLDFELVSPAVFITHGLSNDQWVKLQESSTSKESLDFLNESAKKMINNFLNVNEKGEMETILGSKMQLRLNNIFPNTYYEIDLLYYENEETAAVLFVGDVSLNEIQLSLIFSGENFNDFKNDSKMSDFFKTSLSKSIKYKYTSNIKLVNVDIDRVLKKIDPNYKRNEFHSKLSSNGFWPFLYRLGDALDSKNLNKLFDFIDKNPKFNIKNFKNNLNINRNKAGEINFMFSHDGRKKTLLEKVNLDDDLLKYFLLSPSDDRYLVKDDVLTLNNSIRINFCMFLNWVYNQKNKILYPELEIIFYRKENDALYDVYYSPKTIFAYEKGEGFDCRIKKVVFSLE